MFAIFPEPMYYDWGDSQQINRYFHSSVPPVLPLAELWMGTHPKGPSRLASPKDGKPLIVGTSLLELVKKYPDEMLGKGWVTPDGNPGLPFLFKILSAGKGLSIQVHPNLQQAKDGFQRENTIPIPLGAYNRNYKDQNHKPECIYALSDFFALRGFREPSEILELLSPAKSVLDPALRELNNSDPQRGLKGFLQRLLGMETRELQQAVGILMGSERGNSQDPQDPYTWFAWLNTHYPNDPGIFAAFYLNIIHMQPG